MTRAKTIYTSISVRTSSIILLLIILGTANSAAQLKLPKFLNALTDSTAFFRGVAVSADLVGPAQLLLSDYGHYQAELRVNLKGHYFPVVELGIGKSDKTDDVTRLTYTTSAPYGKVGLDVNLLKNKEDVYRFYVGGRYAFTSFKYDLSSPGISDPAYGGESPYAVEGEKCNCHWLEACAGVDAKIVGPLHMGWMVRYKMRVKHEDGIIGEPWYTPGYGLTGSSRIGATFHVIVEL